MKKSRVKRCLSLILAAAVACSVLATSASAEDSADTLSESGMAFQQSFQNPDASSRPTMRWWISVAADEERIREEVREIAAAGYGAAEIVPFDIKTNSGVDLDVYGWGTEHWSKLMKAALEEAGKCGIKLDFTISIAWPISSPNIKSTADPASEVKLDVGRINLTSGQYYLGELPGSAVENSKLLSVSVAKLAEDGQTYEFDSIVDITDNAFRDPDSRTGYKVHYQTPDDGEYALFASWEAPTEKLKSGFYVIDHYGTAGAESILKYWEEEFIPSVGEDLFRANARSIFCDSLEQSGNWSRQFLETFQEEKGYDSSPYIFHLAGGHYNATYKLSDSELSKQIQRDYYDVLTTCFIDYHLNPIREFCHKYGKTLRYQTAYGKTLELAETAMHVDIPEGESMMIRNTIDNFRAQAGAVHTTGKNLYTAEIQAEGSRNYVQDWDDFLWILQRQWAGGINNFTQHGMSYRGDFHGEDYTPENGYIDGLEWPGYEGFGRANYSNNWNRLPSWEHISDYTDYVSRTQTVLQQGKADVDLAVYRNDYMDNISGSDGSWIAKDGDYIYKDGGQLERAGYTYDFVCPANLALEDSVVKNGVLCADGPSYKAMIIQYQSYMPTATAQRILEYAQNGLPVILIGDTPTVTSNLTEDNTQLVALMKELLAVPNVKQVESYDDVLGALNALSVQPDTFFSQQEEVLTVHRSAQDADFYYVYNFGRCDNTKTVSEPARDSIKPVDFEVSFVGEGVPYLLDAWTGEITPIAAYKAENGRITVNVKLDSNESKLIAFASPEWGGATQTSHAVSSAGGEVMAAENGLLKIRSFDNGTASVELDNGWACHVTVEDIEAPVELTDWNLTVKDYCPGDTPIETVFRTIDVGETTLKSWTEIDGIRNAAGIGTYTTSFTLQQGWEQGKGAILDLGRVQDSFHVTVNGTALAPCNRYTSKVDIGPYVVAGENTVVVEVATTLVNKLIEVIPGERRTVQDYGLLGPVTVTPYSDVLIAPSSGALETLIAKAEQLKADGALVNTMPAVVTEFEAALASAKSLQQTYASQEEIRAASIRLLDAIGMVKWKIADKDDLSEAIYLAEYITSNIDRYLDEGKAELDAALKGAVTVMQDDNAFQSEVDTAYLNLMEAVTNMNLKPDKSKLQSLVDSVSQMDLSQYTAASVERLNAALSSARGVLGDQNAVQGRVDEAEQNLQEAINGLEKVNSPVVDTAVQGDKNGATASGNAKTGETISFAVILSLFALAGTGLALSKKKK